jgi:hypothetical protein
MRVPGVVVIGLLIWFFIIGENNRQEELCHGRTVDESVYYICDQQGFEKYLSEYALEADVAPTVKWEGRKVFVDYQLHYTSVSADQNMRLAWANIHSLLATVSTSRLADSLAVTVRSNGVIFMELVFPVSFFELLPKESTHDENIDRIDELIEEYEMANLSAISYSSLERYAEEVEINPEKSCGTEGCRD